MALYTIGDTHLSLGADKPMDVFGARWTDHAEKIRSRWSSLITEKDTVVIPGDFSWGLLLKDTVKDFEFIDSLPGKKIISKGNHDYWWTTVTKMKRFLSENGVQTVDFLYNNAYIVDNIAVCGSRGWFIEEKLQADIFNADYTKLVKRECDRLSLSLAEGEKLKENRSIPTVAFLHFPPVYSDFVCEPIVDLLVSAKVDHVYYGHIHGDYYVPSTLEYRGLKFSLISADYLNFTPQRVFI